MEDGGGRTRLGRVARPVLGPASELRRRLTAGAGIGNTSNVLVESEAGGDVLVHRLRYKLTVSSIFRQRELRARLRLRHCYSPHKHLGYLCLYTTIQYQYKFGQKTPINAHRTPVADISRSWKMCQIINNSHAHGPFVFHTLVRYGSAKVAEVLELYYFA